MVMQTIDTIAQMMYSSLAHEAATVPLMAPVKPLG